MATLNQADLCAATTERSLSSSLLKSSQVLSKQASALFCAWTFYWWVPPLDAGDGERLGWDQDSIPLKRLGME